jgi:membrane protease YdiL (CAAX protease family)
MSLYTTSPFFFNGLMAALRPYTKLLFAVLLMFMSYLLITLLSMLLALPLFSLTWTGLNAILGEGLTTADIALIKYFQITQTIGLFLLPALLLNYILFYSEERFLTGKVVSRPYIILIIIVLLIVSIPLISKLIEWNTAIRFPSWAKELESTVKQMEDERNDLTIRMLNNSQIQQLLFNIFMIAVVPALGEEFIFRGILQQLLAKWTRHIHLSIFISAMLFSAIHFQFYGFIPRLLLGMLFGYLFYWSGNIWLAVWAHFINNAFAVILLFIENTGHSFLPDIFKEEHHATLWEVMISLSLTVLVISYLWKSLHSKQDTRSSI